MRNKLRYAGLMMGTVMMITTAGASSAFAAKQPANANKTIAAAAKKENKATTDAGKQATETKKDAAKQAKETKKQDTIFYGKVKKAETDKLILDEAALIWKKDVEAGGKTEKAKDAKDNAKAPADFETDTMKWKLDGKTLEFKISKDTKFVQETASTDKKNEDSKKKNNDKSGKKEKDVSSSNKNDATQNPKIELKDIKEGVFVRVTVKDSGDSGVSEVMVLSGVTEAKPA